MRILNFGSLNADYVYDVEHFVRAGETISSKSLNRYPGGKGLNQSIALSLAGAEVFHAGQVGRDGRFLVDLLASKGVDTSRIAVDGEASTGHAIIQRDERGDNCIILHGGANQSLGEGTIGSAFSGFASGDWLLVQNEVNGLGRIVDAGKMSGMRVALNPSPADERLSTVDLGAVDLLVLNELEAAWLCGARLDAGVATLERILGERFPHATTVLTLGKSGSRCIRASEPVVVQGSYAVETADTTGAGDTYIGYLLAGIVEGEPIEVAMRRAAAASAIAVTRPGAATSIPTRYEVEAFISEREER